MKPKVAVFCGGISPEREVSLVSGKFVFEALSKNFDAQLVRLDENKVPQFITPREYVVYPAMHGGYGENGQLQKELAQRGIEFAGCEELSSRVCMVKPAAKALMRAAGVPVPKEIIFDAKNPPSAEALESLLGEKIIIKPADNGSSVGLRIAKSTSEIPSALENLQDGLWLAEEMFEGRELSVGVIGGKAAGVVEIKPQGGVYDFKRKYTAGSTVYEYPAKLSEEQTAAVRADAQKAYEACSCRDFARVDFLIKNDSLERVALELNTLPGMTPTSLLPKSASCMGIDYETLCKNLVMPAMERYFAKYK